MFYAVAVGSTWADATREVQGALSLLVEEPPFAHTRAFAGPGLK